MGGLIGELRIASPGQMFHHASSQVPSALIEMRYHAATDATVPYLFYAVRCDDFEAFDAALGTDPTLRSPTVVTGDEHERLYRVEPTPDFMVVPEVARLGGALLNAWCRDGAWTSRVQFPDREALAALREFCRGHDAEFEVRRLYRATTGGEWGDVGLTEAQREAMVAAFDAGYFDDPRDATLEDVADTLGISSTAVGRRLRRGTAHLVENVLLDAP